MIAATINEARSDEQWQAAKRRQQALAERHAGIREAPQAHALLNARRPAYMLSGLLECGTCGGSYTVVIGDRWS